MSLLLNKKRYELTDTDKEFVYKHLPSMDMKNGGSGSCLLLHKTITHDKINDVWMAPEKWIQLDVRYKQDGITQHLMKIDDNDKRNESSDGIHFSKCYGDFFVIPGTKSKYRIEWSSKLDDLEDAFLLLHHQGIEPLESVKEEASFKTITKGDPLAKFYDPRKEVMDNLKYRMLHNKVENILLSDPSEYPDEVFMAIADIVELPKKSCQDDNGFVRELFIDKVRKHCASKSPIDADVLLSDAIDKALAQIEKQKREKQSKEEREVKVSQAKKNKELEESIRKISPSTLKSMVNKLVHRLDYNEEKMTFYMPKSDIVFYESKEPLTTDAEKKNEITKFLSSAEGMELALTVLKDA